VTNPVWGSNGEDVYRRTYQRTKSNGEHETWLDTVTRVVDGNLALVDPKHTEPGERETLIDHIYNFKLIPAGRHLWASGVKGRQYLFNCFRAGTLVHTQTGVVPIEKLSGQTVEVLSEGGVYRSAKFDSYGEQALYKVTLARGEELFATADHQWIIMQPDGPRRVPTTRLTNKRVPFNPAPRPDETPDYFEGLAHGIVYGDGTRSGASSTMISLFGAKRELETLLLPFSRRGSVEHPDRVYVGTLPREWKDLPGEHASRSYWRGFINGLIATDGTVLSGSALLDQSSAEALAEIRIGAMWAGFVPTQIKMTRTHNPYNGEYAPSFRLTLRGWSVQKEDLVRFDQRSKFHPRIADTRTTRVVSVEPTGIVEEVFCAVEPETHTITVGSGILTGQCHVSGWGNTLSEHAMFTFLRLMEGGGVGANYSLRYLRGYSSLNELRVHVVCDDRHPDYQAMLDQGLLSTKFVSDWDGAYQVDDSREGWALALGDLLDTYARDDVQHTDRVYDVSNVRGAGARLKTFGGTASGPAPFARMLLKVADVMNKVSDSVQVMPLDAMAIDHAVAECVVSGGNRRSARMSIIHWRDPQVFEFIRCKEDTGEHWSTNISVEIDNEFLAALADRMHDNFFNANWVMQEVTEGMLRNGEPGLWNSSLSNVGEPNEVICTNPCGEIALEEFENCNLGHVNLGAFSDGDDLENAHRLMARFLLRATFGDVNDPRQAAVLARNRRIGVGHLGVQAYLALRGIRYSEAPNLVRFRKLLTELRAATRKAADEYAFLLRIPAPVKVTTVAPTGSIAKLPGTTEGIHPIYARYFIRRIRYSTVDPRQRARIEEFRAQGYHVENDVSVANTAVVSFPTKESLVAEVEAMGLPADIVESSDELTVSQLLEFQALYQECYADNAVSFTVNVLDGSITREELAATLVDVLPRLKGTTVFPDKTRPQSPYERISQAEYELAEYALVGDGTDEECANNSCPVR
jgi:adenosylcobalamin-dependent ribonucleoside-triphosphate reductase